MNERSFYEWTVVYGEKLLWSGLGEVGLARTSQPFSFLSSPISPNPFHLKGREQGQSYQCSGIMSHFYSFHVPLNFTSPGQLSWRPTFPFKSSGWLANSSPFHLHTNHHPWPDNDLFIVPSKAADLIIPRWSNIPQFLLKKRNFCDQGREKLGLIKIWSNIPQPLLP